MIIQHTLTPEEIKESMKPYAIWIEACICAGCFNEKCNPNCCTCNGCHNLKVLASFPFDIWWDEPSISYPDANTHVVIYRHGEHIIKFITERYKADFWGDELTAWVTQVHRNASNLLEAPHE